MATWTRRLEAGVAVALTIAAVWLHWLSAASAGGLWRDEANTVALANLPGFRNVWDNLQYDSFPIVWLAVVRLFSQAFSPTNDPAFRALGFVIGVSVVASLWFIARTYGHRFPLASLALIALSPSVITWGDSMRAYGLGMVLITLCGCFLWRFVESPSRSRFAVTTLFAIVSVNTLYYNAVVLVALCAGAFAVCLRRRELKIAMQVAGIGAIAAVSLIPYAATIASAAKWNSLVRIRSFTLEWFWLKLYEALLPTGASSFVIWSLAFVLAVVAALAMVARPDRTRIFNRQRDVALNGLVVLAVGAIGSFYFLKTLAYVTQPWYYLTLLLSVGIAIDIIFGALVVSKLSRIAVSLTALAIGLITFEQARTAVVTRMTNADIVAERLAATASVRDLVLVNPWYLGVSFDRYYHGKAPWMTVPPISFHTFHRYDLVMEISRPRDRLTTMQPVLNNAHATLANGGTVFLVGALPRVASAVQILNPYESDQFYQRKWESELSDFLRLHSTRVNSVAVPVSTRVNRYENTTITAFR